MRIERVGLEHHRKPAPCRRQLGGVPAVDDDLAIADVLQSRDQPQKRGLAAARGADEDDKLAVGDTRSIEGMTAWAPKTFDTFLRVMLPMVLPLFEPRRPYLTAPKVRPRTSCFCENQPRMRMGAIAIVEAADSLA